MWFSMAAQLWLLLLLLHPLSPHSNFIWLHPSPSEPSYSPNLQKKNASLLNLSLDVFEPKQQSLPPVHLLLLLSLAPFRPVRALLVEISIRLLPWSIFVLASDVLEVWSARLRRLDLGSRQVFNFHPHFVRVRGAFEINTFLLLFL